MFIFSAEDKLNELVGPSTSDQWLKWKTKTTDHKNRDKAKKELERIISAEPVSGTCVKCSHTLLNFFYSIIISNVGIIQEDIKNQENKVT